MKRVNLLRILFACSFVVFVGCHGEIMPTKELKNIIDTNLQKGASNQEIKNFFDEQGWLYEYDRYADRYQVRVPNEDNFPDTFGGHQIYVYVDKDMKFIKAEVIKMYNAP